MLKKNVLLKNHTSFKIGGRALYFLEAKTKPEIISAIYLAENKNWPFFILGQGSNVLVSDQGFKGLIIKIKNQKLKIKKQNQKFKILEVESGTSLPKLVNFAAQNGLAGLEWAVGIPGTVGGAIYGNAGAFGKSMADLIKEVEVLDEKFKIKKYKNYDCKFSYRESIFKRKANLIILSAKIKLKKEKKAKIKKKMKEYLAFRKKTQPLSFPSAGSIFKNPPGKSAAVLIEKAGLKGKKIGQAQISKKHANFIINLGGAQAWQVKKLIDLVKSKVKQKFGIDLKEEIRYLGF